MASDKEKGGSPPGSSSRRAPEVLRDCYWAGASSAGSTSGTQSCAPAFVALVSLAVAHRSEAATSSASISTTVWGSVLGLPGVALDRRALTSPPTHGLRAKKQTLYKRCAVSGLRMGVTYVFLRVWCDTFILINAWGRSSVGRAPALQVDND